MWDFPEESPSVESLAKALSEATSYELPEAIHFSAPPPFPEFHIDPVDNFREAEAFAPPPTVGPLGAIALSTLAIVVDLADQMIFIKGQPPL